MRLIDANQLIDYFNKAGWDGVQAAVDAMPTVDPVVHGRWVFDNYTKRLRCSECEAYKPYDVVADIIDYWDCDYCPNCGAKMDGEVKT